MTDRSIVTALEKCSAEGKPCAGCPYANTATLDKFCDAKLMEDAVELINRQEAMIDKLNAMVEAAEDYLHQLPFRNAFDKAIEKARADGIKEFAERLKEKFSDLEYRANTPRKTVRVDELRSQVDWVLHEVTNKTINDLVKETVGADNAE